MFFPVTVSTENEASFDFDTDSLFRSVIRNQPRNSCIFLIGHVMKI